MDLNVKTVAGAESGPINVADAVFGADFNEPLVHQVVTASLARNRAGTKAQKARSDVQGGGIKPWRQKGTGRARAGTLRSPLWRGGGRTFAARPRKFDPKINRKMYRGAMRSILSELLRAQRLVVVDSLRLDEPRTKHLISQLAALSVADVLLVVEEIQVNLYLAARNLKNVEVREVADVDPAALLAFEKVVVTAAALKQLEEQLV